MVVESILQLGRGLPAPIRKPLSRIYDRVRKGVILDKDVIKELADFFDLTYAETICMLKVGTKLNKMCWNILNPETEDEIQRFYEVNPFYAFSLAY